MKHFPFYSKNEAFAPRKVDLVQTVWYITFKQIGKRGKEKFYGKSFPHVYGGG